MSAIELNDKRQIVIELSWLLSALTDEQKRELADSLACEDSIIKDVAAQLLTGWTERSSHGARSCGTDAEPTTPLDRARRELANRADSVAKDEIAGLKHALVWAKAMEEYYSGAYFRAYHAWSDRDVRMCPELGPIPVPDHSAYEVVKKTPQPNQS